MQGQGMQYAEALPGKRLVAPQPERRTAAAPERLWILGVPFADMLFDEAVEQLRELLATRGAKQVVLANAHTLNLATAAPAYRQVLLDAALVLRDGVGIELASLLLGRRLRGNFVGTDFVPRCLGALADMRPRVLLFGARPGVADRAGRVLEERCPGVRIVGALDGYGDAP